MEKNIVHEFQYQSQGVSNSAAINILNKTDPYISHYNSREEG